VPSFADSSGTVIKARRQAGGREEVNSVDVIVLNAPTCRGLAALF
jgi:hypothetical protein